LLVYGWIHELLRSLC